MQYLCTYGSGWDKAIKIILSKNYKNLEIKSIGDGIAIFETDELIDPKKLFFFNNVYVLIKSIKCNTTNFDKNVSTLVNEIRIEYKKIKYYIKKMNSKSFKIISIDGNQPCKIDYNKVSKLENNIKMNLGLVVSKKKHDLDFVFLQRTNGMMYFLLKLSYNRVTEKKIEQGSLRPEVAYLLSSLADIKETDIILDPFTGSGAIPKEIMKRYKYNMIFASEIDNEKYAKLKKEFKNNSKYFFVKNFDALDMNFFENNFIDCVVTDPPWNIFEHENKSYTEFYYKMLLELNRIVKPNGKIIILMGNENEFEDALDKIESLKLNDRLSVLINGKKAKVYIIEVFK